MGKSIIIMTGNSEGVTNTNCTEFTWSYLMRNVSIKNKSDILIVHIGIMA